MTSISNLPKITLITPNYNMGEYLEHTMVSVLSQGYPNLEYMVIDGGSTDQSVEIIQKYAAQLAYWESEPDAGMYAAIQKGMARSTGEIMGWLNSDDLLHPGALFVLAEVFMRDPQVTWLQGIPTAFDEKGRTVAVEAQPRMWSKYHYHTGNYRWIQQECTYWRRSLWEKAGSTLDTELRYAGDLALWMRFFRFAPLYHVNALLGGFRVRRTGQLSSATARYQEEAQAVLQREIAHFSWPYRLKVQGLKLALAAIHTLGRLKLFRTHLFENLLCHGTFRPRLTFFFDHQQQQFKRL